MKELDKSKVYDLSELTSEEYDTFLKEVHCGDIKQRLNYYYHEYFSNILEEGVYLVNAKELFYTLENIQVDCTELTEEQVKEMCKVFENNGYKQWVNKDALKIEDNYTYLRIDWENEFFINSKDYDKTTITYEQFMELFAPKYEVKYIAEKPTEEKPQHYAKGIDTFSRMEANCTKEECLAFAKGNIDKYNWREKGQDLEDYKKIIAYANWAIKLLEK